ncbi:MAG: DUF1573 domain-containing protein, partial [Planctomycetota bacterium]
MPHHAHLSSGNQLPVVRTAARFLAAASLGLALQLVAAPQATACPHDDASVQEQDAKKQDAKKQDAKKQEAKKQDAFKNAGAGKKGSVGRSRLSGRGAPPKPAAIPSARPSSGGVSGKIKSVPTGANSSGAAAAKAGQKSAPTVKQQPVAGSAAQMTAEQRRYEEKLKQAQAKKPTAAPRPPRNPNAKLEIPFGMEKHDFGRARQGDLLMHTFKLQSSGSEPVIISQASPTCGCTLNEVKVLAEGQEVPSLYSYGSPIAPGSEIQISATLDTKS